MAARKGNNRAECEFCVDVNESNFEWLNDLGILPSGVLRCIVDGGHEHSILRFWPIVRAYFFGYSGGEVYSKWNDLWFEKIWFTFESESMKLPKHPVRERAFLLPPELHPTPHNFRDNISPAYPTLPYWFERAAIDTSTLRYQPEVTGVEWLPPYSTWANDYWSEGPRSIFMLPLCGSLDHMSERQELMAAELLKRMSDKDTRRIPQMLLKELDRYIEENIEEEELVFTRFSIWLGRSEDNLQVSYLSKHPYLRTLLKEMFLHKRKAILERRKQKQAAMAKRQYKRK